MEGFLIRGWDPIVPGGANLFLEPQPISDWPMGLGFPHRAGRFRPGGSPFSSPGCRNCRCMEGMSEPGIRTCPPRVRRDRGVSPRGNSRRTSLTPSLAEGRRCRSPRPMRLGLGKRWDESFAYYTYIECSPSGCVRHEIPGVTQVDEKGHEGNTAVVTAHLCWRKHGQRNSKTEDLLLITTRSIIYF